VREEGSAGGLRPPFFIETPMLRIGMQQPSQVYGAG